MFLIKAMSYAPHNNNKVISKSFILVLHSVIVNIL